jgi:hypothetical protein
MAVCWNRLLLSKFGLVKMVLKLGGKLYFHVFLLFLTYFLLKKMIYKIWN